MLMIIDNYDSFTHNLARYFKELGAEVAVYRSDVLTVDELVGLAPQRVVLSPGPGRPEQAGVTLAMINRLAGKVPMLGVCLGHQAIAQAFGAKVVHAKRIMHAKTSKIFHNNSGLFASLPQAFVATRYHSLVVSQASLPDCFEVCAWTQDSVSQCQEVMAIAHRSWPLYGVQFHPESVLTESGYALLEAFLQH